MLTRKDPWTWVGLAVVGVTALVWSFTALSDLARRCGITAVINLFGWQQVHVAWGLPITVDVLALVATRVWLRGDAPDEAVTYARRAAWAAIVATVVGNGYHGLIVGSFAFDALIVSAAPAVVIGVIVHLAVLVGRPATPADEHPPDVTQPPADDTEPARDVAQQQRAAEQAAPANATATLPGGIPVVPVPTGPTAEPDRSGLDDAAIVSDAEAWSDELGRRPTRDEMLRRYRIGSGRARTLRQALGWAEPTGSVPDTADTRAVVSA